MFIHHLPFMNAPRLAVQRRLAVERFFEAIRRGDREELTRLLTADAVTRWPQSGERITGAMSCIRVHESYPGGPPKYRVNRITGSGEVWAAELVSDYGDQRWYALSVIEFRGARIARMTDYFGQAFPAPDWRSEMVELEVGPA
jgi:hypothetical protein